MALFGMHLSIAGGLASAVTRGVELGCDCFQLFARNPRSLRAKPLEAEQATAFRHARGESKMGPVVVHVNYLINLASPKDETWELSCEALTDELARAQMIGADFVVMHPGNHVGSGVERGIVRIVEAIDKAFDASDSSVVLCMENMAGAGTEVGREFSELQRIIEASRYRDRLGICLDTCHAYGAGYDVASEEGLTAMIQEIYNTVGIERLRFVHANDTMGELGARKDRHQHIGEGSIGLTGFRMILAHKEFANLPFILETPVDSPDDQVRDLAQLRSCAGV